LPSTNSVQFRVPAAIGFIAQH